MSRKLNLTRAKRHKAKRERMVRNRIINDRPKRLAAILNEKFVYSPLKW